MKYKGILIVFLIIILGGGIFFFSQNSDSNTPPTPDYDQIAMMTIYPSGTPAEGVKESGQYLKYSKNVLNTVKGKKVVIFFYANWCSTCIPADADFTKNVGKLPEDVVVIRVNYNDSETDQDEKDLAKKYGITYQHTFVQIDANDKEVAKWNGGQTEELLTNIK